MTINLVSNHYIYMTRLITILCAARARTHTLTSSTYFPTFDELLGQRVGLLGVDLAHLCVCMDLCVCVCVCARAVCVCARTHTHKYDRTDRQTDTSRLNKLTWPSRSPNCSLSARSIPILSVTEELGQFPHAPSSSNDTSPACVRLRVCARTRGRLC